LPAHATSGVLQKASGIGTAEFSIGAPRAAQECDREQGSSVGRRRAPLEFPSMYTVCIAAELAYRRMLARLCLHACPRMHLGTEFELRGNAIHANDPAAVFRMRTITGGRRATAQRGERDEGRSSA
jgi:hypothetical protein